MWPFKKKIKEQPKGRMYGNRYTSQNYSVWDNMSLIEQICFILLPIMLCFIFYMILDVTGLVSWLRIIISIGMVAGCITIITALESWLTGE